MTRKPLKQAIHDRLMPLFREWYPDAVAAAEAHLEACSAGAPTTETGRSAFRLVSLLWPVDHGATIAPNQPGSSASLAPLSKVTVLLDGLAFEDAAGDQFQIRGEHVFHGEDLVMGVADLVTAIGQNAAPDSWEVTPA